MVSGAVDRMKEMEWDKGTVRWGHGSQCKRKRREGRDQTHIFKTSPGQLCAEFSERARVRPGGQSTAVTTVQARKHWCLARVQVAVGEEPRSGLKVEASERVCGVSSSTLSTAQRYRL